MKLEENLYYKPQICPDGSFLSVDMIRLKIKMEADAIQPFGQWILNNLQFSDATFREHIYGNYRYLWAVKIGENGFAFGMHLQPQNSAHKPDVGFLEFNPNKLGSEPLFQDFMRRLLPLCHRVSLVRFDLAQDFQIPRSKIRMRKGRGVYTYRMFETLTEYTGTRNSPGYCKLYDKQAERKLDNPLTRLEMTCDGEWSPQEIAARSPHVAFLPAPPVEMDNPVHQVMAESLRRLQEQGEPIEDLLRQLHYRLRKKIEPHLSGQQTRLFPEEQTSALLADLQKDWTY